MSGEKSGGAPVVSVCVPVFNTSRYLRQCLESLLAQTLSAIEVIVVDDGSSDDSLKAAEDVASRDSRVIVITQENRGLGATRNRGLAQASGKYVAFLDSDDWAEPEWCEALYVQAEAGGVDVVVCDHRVELGERTGRRSVDYSHPECINNRAAYVQAIAERSVPGFSWNKLYRRELLARHALRFPLRRELQNVEDQYYSLRAAYYARSVGFVRRPLVHYRVHGQSIVQRYQPTLLADYVELYARNHELLRRDPDCVGVLAGLKASFVRGVAECALNECKESNPASIGERLAALRRLSEHPLFRSLYDAEPSVSAQARSVRVVLSALRSGSPAIAYLCAAACRRHVRRATS